MKWKILAALVLLSIAALPCAAQGQSAQGQAAADQAAQGQAAADQAAQGQSAADQAARDQAYKDPAKLAELVAQVPYILVDVRTPEEFAGGHIPTAVNVPVSDIGAKPPTADTGALIIVYCASGHRSALAAKTLTDMGYTRIVDFGAVSRWKGPLVKAEAK